MNSSSFFVRKTFADQATVWIMLLLLTLPSVGITVAASNSLSGSQRPAGTEEVEERASCSAQRRIQVDLAIVHISSLGQLATSSFSHPAELDLRPVAVGHRLSNGLLAPMRC